MKNILSGLLAGLILLIIFTGCDKRKVDVPTDPTQVSSDDARRVLSFRYDTTISGYDYYSIALFDTDNKYRDISDDIVEVTIGDSIVPLEYLDYIPPWQAGWYSFDSHVLSETQTLKLRINSSTVLSTNVTAVHKANAAFPDSYDYQQELTLNWAVNAGNQYQFVKAEAWHNNIDGEYNPYSSYLKQIASYARTHTFPAECVMLDGNPENTTFVLCVQEVNYKIVNKNAVMVYQEESYGYGFNKPGIIKKSHGKSAFELFRLL